MGPILLGVLISATSYGTMYAVLVAVVVAASLLYHAVHGRASGGRPNTP